MARPHDQRSSAKLAAGLCALATVLAACARYDGETKLYPVGGAGKGGADSGGTSPGGAGVGTGGGTAPGSGGSPANGGGGAGAGSGGSPANGGGGTAAGTPGTGGGTAGGTTGAGGSTLGGTGGSGGAGNAGRGGASGASGSVGSAGSAGTGGSVGVEHLLSQGKPASADSEETTKGNLAALGNDGVATSRWCAADGLNGHYWQVDLGQSHTLSKLQITWEKAVVYQFKVEGSPQGTTWSLLLDQTGSTNNAAAQSYTLTGAPTARWVRVTTTTLPDPYSWASFFEFGVFGY